MNSLLRKATDPRQYDQPRLHWEEEGLTNSPSRTHFHYYLKRYLPSLRGKRVVDIGSGTGHLSKLLRQLGATTLVGIEPSKKNVALSRRYFPVLRVYRSSLEKFKTKEKFDVAIVVMAFEHFPNVHQALTQIGRLLIPGGRLIAIVGEFRYHIIPRFDYTIHRQPLADGSMVVGVERSFGTLYDIIRPVSVLRGVRLAAIRLRDWPSSETEHSPAAFASPDPTSAKVPTISNQAY